MLYTAQVRFDRTDLSARLCEALDWFKTRGLKPGPFRYMIAGDVIRLRIEFAELSQASDFAESLRRDGAGRLRGARGLNGRTKNPAASPRRGSRPQNDGS
jgi:hypothetical protein